MTTPQQSTDTAAYLRLLHRDGDVFEIRSPKCPHRPGADFASTHSGYFNDVGAAVNACRILERLRPPGSYVTLNPVTTGLLARAANRIVAKATSTTGDGEVLVRRCLLIDIDSVRPSGVSATESEMLTALDLARKMREELAAAGWPDAILCMSGNGAYLVYLIDLPNDEDATDLVKRVLEGLADRFNTVSATVDTTTFNASRIHKLPGTTARKGDDLQADDGIEARPHRMAWFEPPCGPLNHVPVDLLRAIATPKPEPIAKTSPSWSSPITGSTTVMDRCRKYVAKLPDAISGQGGHSATLQVACETIRFGLSDADAMVILGEYNTTRTSGEPWTEKELAHKLADARDKVSKAGQVGCRLQSQPLKTSTRSPASPKPSNHVPLQVAAQNYLVSAAADETLIDLAGIPEINHAIGGGVERGEMVIVAALPGHGKSAFAMQCLHSCARNGMAGLLISEEMSVLALGKRTLQYVSPVPPDAWNREADHVKRQLDAHFRDMAPIHIVESCRTPDVVEREVERAVAERNVEIVVVDYVQLLAARGSKYEAVSDASTRLRRIATSHNVLLIALCQLNRDLGKRDKCIPRLADLRDSGQLEQDADVVMFLVRPYRLDPTRDPAELLMFVAKNRNRDIVKAAFGIRFEGARQRFAGEGLPDNHESAFDGYSLNPSDEGVAI